MSERLKTEADYRAALARRGLLWRARKWLDKNPPPPEWTAGPYAYAFTEMPVL